MMDARAVTPEVLQVARSLLTEHGADLGAVEPTFEATQTVLRQLYEHLRPRIGDGGFRSVLQLAHRRAVATHPALEALIVQADTNPFLGEVPPATAKGDGDDLCQGFVQVVGEALCLIRELGQDQDWGLVELWPGLKALEEENVPLRPDPEDQPAGGP